MAGFCVKITVGQLIAAFCMAALAKGVTSVLIFVAALVQSYKKMLVTLAASLNKALKNRFVFNSYRASFFNSFLKNCVAFGAVAAAAAVLPA